MGNEYNRGDYDLNDSHDYNMDDFNDCKSYDCDITYSLRLYADPTLLAVTLFALQNNAETGRAMAESLLDKFFNPFALKYKLTFSPMWVTVSFTVREIINIDRLDDADWEFVLTKILFSKFIREDAVNEALEVLGLESMSIVVLKDQKIQRIWKMATSPEYL